MWSRHPFHSSFSQNYCGRSFFFLMTQLPSLAGSGDAEASDPLLLFSLSSCGLVFSFFSLRGSLTPPGFPPGVGVIGRYASATPQPLFHIIILFFFLSSAFFPSSRRSSSMPNDVLARIQHGSAAGRLPQHLFCFPPPLVLPSPLDMRHI